MEYKNLLFGFLLCCTLLTASSAYMIFEEKQNTDTSVGNNKMKLPDLPPISIVDLTKTSKKINRKEVGKSVKRKSQRKMHPWQKPSPPPSCMATWAAFKPPCQPCCDFCAFCHCRLFQTVCYCRLGNPNC